MSTAGPVQERRTKFLTVSPGMKGIRFVRVSQQPRLRKRLFLDLRENGGDEETQSLQVAGRSRPFSLIVSSNEAKRILS